MLLRTTDPFRDLDRLTQQLMGTTNRPAVMPMDAWREGDRFVIEFDLPGVNADSIDLDVERNVLTVRAERVARNGDWEPLASERPRGAFSRQLVLGDNLDLERIEAGYADGVLRLVVPVAEKAKPRKIEISPVERERPARRADRLTHPVPVVGSPPLRSVRRPHDRVSPSSLGASSGRIRLLVEIHAHIRAARSTAGPRRKITASVPTPTVAPSSQPPSAPPPWTTL